MQQYISPDFVPQDIHLDDATYARVLDSIVVACVDCIVVSPENKILLGKRTQEPAKYMWWVVGGRMKPGEQIQATAQRVVKREIGLEIVDYNRFHFVSPISYAWSHRAQQPDRGCHMVGLNVMVHLTSKEMRNVNIAGGFSEIQWLNPDELAKNMNFHAAIRGFANHILHRRQ